MAKLELYNIDNKPFQFIYHWNKHKIFYKLIYLSIPFNCYIMNY